MEHVCELNLYIYLNEFVEENTANCVCNAIIDDQVFVLLHSGWCNILSARGVVVKVKSKLSCPSILMMFPRDGVWIETCR